MSLLVITAVSHFQGAAPRCTGQLDIPDCSLNAEGGVEAKVQPDLH